MNEKQEQKCTISHKNTKPVVYSNYRKIKKLKLKRGYVPYKQCLMILEMKDRVFKGYIRAGKIPKPKSTVLGKFYKVEELFCLLNAKVYATNQYNGNYIFSLKMFSDYISECWPYPQEKQDGKDNSKEASDRS